MGCSDDKGKSIEQMIKENKYFVVDTIKYLQILIETGHTWNERSGYGCDWRFI